MELNYKNIKEALGGDIFAGGMTEDGEAIIYQAHRLKDIREDCDSYTGPLEQPEEAYSASWVTKRNENGEWWVTQWFHEDGTIEETYEHIGSR